MKSAWVLSAVAVAFVAIITLGVFMALADFYLGRRSVYAVGGRHILVPTASTGLKNDAKVIQAAAQQVCGETPLNKDIVIERSFLPVNKSKTALLLNADTSVMFGPMTPGTILLKTRHAADALAAVNRLDSATQTFLGFTSVDRRRDCGPKQRAFLHIAGKSPYKNTDVVLKAWMKHPEWPRLTILARRKIQPAWFKPLPNLAWITDFVPDEEVVRLMNTTAFHLCPSRNEGFGHYLNEARSVGAVVLFSDAPPMNEMFVDGTTGVAIKCTTKTTKHAFYLPALLAKPSTAQIEDAVERALALAPEERETMGNAARAAFEADRKAFHRRFRDVLCPGDKHDATR